MKNLIEKVKQAIKWSLAHLGKTLFGIAIGSYVIYLGGIFHVYETILIYLKILLQLYTPVWATIGLVFLPGVYIYLRITRKYQTLSAPYTQKYFKYCPDCNEGINEASLAKYCRCGIKYLENCPDCAEKIIRGNSRVCSFCGYKFPRDRIPVN